MTKLIGSVLILCFGAMAQISTIPNTTGADFRSRVNTNFSWVAQNASAYCSDAGSTDAYACNMNPALTAYNTGAIYRFKANTANTGAATVNFNSLGVLTIKKLAGGVTTDLADNDIRAGQWVTLVYDGTNMQMMSASGNAASGSGDVVGPASATNNALARFDTTTGKAIKNSAVTVDDSGNVTTPGTVTSGSGITTGGHISLGNATGDTAASYFEANSGDGASNAEPGYLKLWSSHTTKRQASLFPCTDANGFLCIATATPAADSTDIVLTAANTKTLTNTTLDAEGTGNTITTTSKVWLDAASCSGTTGTLNWDTLATGAPTATCSAGSTNTTLMRGVADFADSGTFQMMRQIMLPLDWTGAIDVAIKWRSSATTGSAVWQVATVCVADAELDDQAWNTASTVTDATKGTANQTNDAVMTSVTATGCAAGELLHLKVLRDPTNASDDLGATASLIGVQVTLRRAQ